MFGDNFSHINKNGINFLSFFLEFKLKLIFGINKPMTKWKEKRLLS